MSNMKNRLAAGLYGLLLASLGCVAAESNPKATLPASDPHALWADIDESQVQMRGERWLQPQSYRAVELDFAAMSSRTGAAPMERSGSSIRIALPVPDGGFAEFDVVESPVMESELQAKFPSIRTYSGQGVHDPLARVRFDVTPLGFHAQVLSPNGDYLIDPMQRNDTDHYVSYYRRDYGPNTKQYQCDTHGDEVSMPKADTTAPSIAKLGTPGTVGTQLRTLRTAIVATSSYTNIFGGTVSSGLSGLTTLVNRLNSVYERDVALRFVLVNNNDLIVYTDSNVGPIGTAPTGPDPIIQTTIDAAIGFANYDIGHAVGGSGGGGAITPLGNVCTAQKSQGFTSFDTAIGDVFDIDFVAHELGHQLGGSHTWNGCSNQSAGQWTASSAMEPGSGTTIMAYAGICSDNVQPNSDANLHARTFTQLLTRLALDETSVPPTCGSNTPTGNLTPTVTAAADFTIPEQTPFELTASASDPNGDALVYNWEQVDTGTRGAPTTTGDNGTAPLFRSYNPTPSPTRVFPALPYILDNANVPPTTISLPPAGGSFQSAERLPNPASGTRVMNFRVTAGDNRAGGAGVAFDQIAVTATSAAGPFSVVDIAGPVVGGASQAVTWNVANTTAAPVNTSSVNILISLDGGITFTSLLAGTPNDGSETVTIPNTATARARLRVEAANGTGISPGNTYFDISTNFAITATGTAITVTNVPAVQFIATKQGSPAPAATAIATVVGGTPPYTLAASAFPDSAEIDIVSLSEATGTVSASAEVSCRLAAPNAPSYRIYPAVLQVTDSAGRKASGVFPIRLTNNDIPSIGTYANQSVATGNSISVSPAAAPVDANGNFVGVSVSPTTLPGGGTVSINPVTAQVTVQTTAGTTLGVHKIRVLAADTCGATAVQQFNVTVTTIDPVLAYNGVAVTTPANAVIEPNECNTLDITLGNIGGSQASSINTTLSSITPGVTITTANSPYAPIASNGAGTNTVDYEVSTDNTVACGSSVAFQQTVTFNGPSSPLTFNFSLPVGQPPSNHYTIASNTQSATMAGGVLVAGSQDDDVTMPITLPAGFDFSFYGTAVTALTGDTNGTLQFAASGGSTASNTTLPAAFGAPTLFAYWDDLDLSAAVTTGGGIYTATNGVAPNRTFDIEWRARRYNATGSSAPTIQFMVRLHETSDLIEVYYSNVTGNQGQQGGVGANGSSATVGIQRQNTGTDFDLFSFDTASLSAGQRLTFTLPPGICNVGPGPCVGSPGTELEFAL